MSGSPVAIALFLAAFTALPGTTAGPKYDVWKGAGENALVVFHPHSVWFNTRADWTRELWKACRSKKMTKRGAVLAVAHARLAGGAWLTPGKTKGPVRGWNLWGIRATDEWKADGKQYYYANGLDWRYYTSPSHGIGGWLFVMRNYPDAKAELFDENASSLAYAHGLFHGTGGRKYKACAGGALGLCGQLLGDQLQAIMDKITSDLTDQGFKL